MATSKITITLQNEQLDAVRRLESAGHAGSVSGFIKHAVGVALLDAAGWQQLLEGALAESGGPLSAEERAWADSILAPDQASGHGGRP